MSLTAILTATVIPWVSGKILDAYEQKYADSALDKVLFPKADYSVQLNKLLIKAVENYEKQFPPTGNFPFYHHKETFAQLSEFVLFKHEDKSILEQIDFTKLENIDQPSQQQIEHFYSFLIQEIKANEKLKELYIEENYKGRVFDIYNEVTLIKSNFDKFINQDLDKVVREWLEQIYSNLEKLKGTTALEEINKVEQELLSKVQTSNANKAFIHFVKALCLNENLKQKEALDYFEQASILNPQNDSYKSWYLYFEYLYNRKTDTIEKVKELLRNMPFDPLLNGVLSIEAIETNGAFAPNDIRLSAQQSVRFKRIIYRQYLSKNNLSLALQFFETDSTDITPELENVSIDNYGYLNLYLQLYFYKTLDKYPRQLYFEIDTALSNSPELKVCIDYFSKFLNKIKDSEKKDLIPLYEYLLNLTLFYQSPNKNFLDAAYAAFLKNKEIISPFYFQLLKCGYSQIGEYQTAIKIFNEKEDEPESLYLKAMLYERINDKQGSINARKGYLEQVTKIDGHNFEPIVNSILIPGLSLQDLSDFYDKVSNGSIALDTIYKDCILATKGSKDDNFKDDSIKLLDNHFKRFAEKTDGDDNLIHPYCQILHSLKIWNGIVGVLINRGILHPENKMVLAEALWYSKSNQPRLLQILEELRISDVYPMLEYYLWEIQLKGMLGAWAEVQSICEQGFTKFTRHNELNYYLALSYLNQNKKIEYTQVLGKMNLTDLGVRNFQILTQGLVELGEASEAVEQAYLYAVFHKDADNRMFFFNIYTFNYDRTAHVIPQQVEKQFIVEIEGPNGTKLINSIDQKPMFEKILGKQVGEEFSIGGMVDTETTYKIKSIKHKYDALMQEIMKEAEQPEFTGLKMKSFHLKEGGTAEDMKEQLIELFGKSGDERHKFFEKTFMQYKTNEISFHQLIHAAFQDDVWNAYMTVTQSPEIGFRSLPNTLSEKAKPVENNDPVCIDLNTLFFFSEVSKKHNITFNRKFILSSHSADYVKTILEIAVNDVGSKMSVDVTSAGVVPFFGVEDLRKLKIEALKDILSWVEANCTISTSKEKLNIVVNLKDTGVELNHFSLAFIDTLAIAIEQNLVLVSDEKAMYAIVKDSNCIIGIEYYLSKYCPSISADKRFNMLSEKNFIGINIPLTQVERIGKALIEKDASSTNFLLNFSIKHTASSLSGFTLISVINYIVSQQIEVEQKKEIIRALFESFLDGLYSNAHVLHNLINLLQLSLFKLMGNNSENYIMVKNELFSVLKKHNVEIEVKK